MIFSSDMAVSVEMQHTGDSAKAIALFSEEFWNSPVGPRRAFIVNNAS